MPPCVARAVAVPASRNDVLVFVSTAFATWDDVFGGTFDLFRLTLADPELGDKSVEVSNPHFQSAVVTAEVLLLGGQGSCANDGFLGHKEAP